MRRMNLLGGAALLIGLTALSPAYATMMVAQAGGEDVSLDNVELKASKPGEKSVIKHLDVKGSSLSEDELKQLFSGDLSDADKNALALKFKADSMTITELDSTDDKTSVVVTNIVADDIDAGKIAKLDVDGADVKAEEGGGHIGALHIESLDLASALDPTAKNKSLSAAGVTALTLAGADLSVPDEQMPKDAPGGRLIHIVVAPIDFTATYDGSFPVKSELTLKGVTVSLAPGSAEDAQMKAFGVDKVQMDAHFASTCDKAAKSCDISDITLNFPNLGSLVLTGAVSNVPTEIASGDSNALMTAMMQESVGALSLKFANAGIYDKIVTFYAKAQNMDADMLKASLPAMTAMVPQALGDPAAGKKLAEALQAFLKDPKSLQVSLKATGGPVPISDISSTANPADLFKKFSFDAAANQ
jgi:hypothetical protein